MNRNYSFQDGVKQAVLEEIKRRVPNGSPVSKQDLKEAYTIVRACAILDTILWKELYITIKE